MADIIDEFVATLGLDTREYDKQIRKYREDRKRLAEEEQKQNRASQDGQSRTVDGLRKLRNETAGFLLMLAGATSVMGFAKDMLTADAATARFARNTGMATERVSVWENALKRVGGTAEEARAALGTLFGIFQNFRLGIDNSKGGALAFFGLRETDLKDPEAALLRIAEVVKSMPRENVEKQLELLGLSGSIVGLLAGDRGELTKLLASVEAAGVANDESAEAAMSLEQELAKTAQTLQGIARPAVTELTKAFVYLTRIINSLIDSRGMQMLNDIFGSGSIAEIKSAADKDAAKDTPEARALRNEFLDNFSGAASSSGRWDGSALGAFRMASRRARPQASGGRDSTRVMNYLARAAGFHSVPSNVRTLGQASDFARRVNRAGVKSSAMGTFQIVGQTLRAYGPRVFGRDWQNQDFNAENQDRLAEAIFNDHRHSASALRNQWVSLSLSEAERVRKMSWSQARRIIARKESGESFGAPNAPTYAARRGPAAGRGVGAVTSSTASTTTIGQINVYTQATDAAGIARDIRSEMIKRETVVQAGGGLRP